MMSPSAAALSHCISAAAETRATEAVLRDTTQCYWPLEGTRLGTSIDLCVLLRVVVVDLLRLSAIGDYSGSMAGWVACEEFERIWKWS